MATNENNFRCSVCKQLYKNPVVHRICGISFDRDCIGTRCPAPECGKIIDVNDLITNYSLLKIVDEYRSNLDVPSSYYLILLDTSTSMRYSDSFLPFAFGESRFTHAIQFLNDFFTKKLDSMSEKVSLVTFDTAQIARFDFTAINKSHLDLLRDLKCDGKDTALFDSIDFCLTKIEYIRTILADQISTVYLFILTDGGNNFGQDEAEHATKILWRSKKLHISGHIIQIGDRNKRQTKTISDFIKYKFNHFKGGNVTDFVNSLTIAIRTEVRALIAQDQLKSNITTQMINQLPEVPRASVRVPSKEKELA